MCNECFGLINGHPGLQRTMCVGNVFTTLLKKQRGASEGVTLTL